jgi:hypothetical protein
LLDFLDRPPTFRTERPWRSLLGQSRAPPVNILIAGFVGFVIIICTLTLFFLPQFSERHRPWIFLALLIALCLAFPGLLFELQAIPPTESGGLNKTQNFSVTLRRLVRVDESKMFPNRVYMTGELDTQIPNGNGYLELKDEKRIYELPVTIYKDKQGNVPKDTKLVDFVYVQGPHRPKDFRDFASALPISTKIHVEVPKGGISLPPDEYFSVNLVRVTQTVDSPVYGDINDVVVLLDQNVPCDDGWLTVPISDIDYEKFPVEGLVPAEGESQNAPMTTYTNRINVVVTSESLERFTKMLPIKAKLYLEHAFPSTVD